MTRVLVCGGRDFTDVMRLNSVMDRLHQHRNFSLVIDGAARGADTLGNEWAKSRGVTPLRFPANWTKYGKKSAGPIRNQQMLDEGKPDLVVAFPGGPGTKDMVRRAKAANVQVIEFKA